MAAALRFSGGHQQQHSCLGRNFEGRPAALDIKLGQGRRSRAVFLPATRVQKLIRRQVIFLSRLA